MYIRSSFPHEEVISPKGGVIHRASFKCVYPAALDRLIEKMMDQTETWQDVKAALLDLRGVGFFYDPLLFAQTYFPGRECWPHVSERHGTLVLLSQLKAELASYSRGGK